MNKGHTISVLDKGYVRYIDHMGSDARIVEAARVSYNSPSKGPEADKKLLHYLYRNKHTSPFEMCKITFDIKMPIFVARQYIRHRMQNVNEVSMRYTEIADDFYIPENWRRQDTKNKQGSIDNGHFNPETVHKTTASRCLKLHCNSAYSLYRLLLSAGVAREMARMVLPLNIYTTFYATWDLKNLLHFITLREDSHAQAEIQDYAKAIKSVLVELFPNTMEAYNLYKWRLDDNQ